jgi:hypothetical protein
MAHLHFYVYMQYKNKSTRSEVVLSFVICLGVSIKPQRAVRMPEASVAPDDHEPLVGRCGKWVGVIMARVGSNIFPFE